jgi:hypothetical protein
VGAHPWLPAFDGENVWVPGNGGVTKLRASDGKNLGTFGVSCVAAAFDGAYIWLTTGGTGTNVIRLKDDGANAGSFQAGGDPLGIAFDGANIWVANNEGSSVTKFRAKDGANLGTFSLGGTTPWGVAFDGNDIWVTTSPDVFELRPSDGHILGIFHDPPGSSVAGIAFDGANIWVAATFNNALNKM